MLMIKPARKKESPEAAYPTLNEFNRDRRRLLKGIAGGAFYLGVGGALAGCLSHPDSGGGSSSADAGDVGVDWPFQRNDAGQDPVVHPPRRDVGHEPTIIPRTDAGEDARSDADAVPNPDADLGPDWGMAGGMPEPTHESVRLPSTDTTPMYTFSSDYITFSVTFMTYDPSFAQFFRDHAEVGLNACVQVLCDVNCDDLANESTIETIETDLAAALNEAYRLEGNDTWSGAEALELSIETCESYYGIDGDGAEPEFPFACN